MALYLLEWTWSQLQMLPLFLIMAVDPEKLEECKVTKY